MYNNYILIIQGDDMKKLLTSLTVMLLLVLLTLGVSAKTVLKGDINMDGRVTASDARSTLRASAKLDEITDKQALVADVNGDSKITAIDARTILRCAASLEKGLGEIELPDDENPENPTTNTPAIKTEISGGIGGTTADFIKKFGGMRQVGTQDGSTQYTNDKITIISNPKMIYTGNINCIILAGGDYTLCGVYAGMSSADAVNILKSDKWTVKEQTSSNVNLTKNAMVMILTLVDGNVTKAEYKFGISLVSPEDPTTESTTKPAETTTKPEETTTKPAETTTKPVEATTKPAETTTAPIGGNTSFDELPEQVKTFLNGNFALNGYNYAEGKKSAVSMYVSKQHVKAGMGLDTGSESMNLDILIRNVDNSKKSQTYILMPDKKLYCELSSFAMSLLGIKPEDLQLNIGSSSNIKSINKTNENSAGTAYVVYTIDTGAEYCKIFTINGEIKRIETYNSADKILKSRIDVTEFFNSAPESAFSLDGYTKKTFTSLFGSLI